MKKKTTSKRTVSDFEKRYEELIGGLPDGLLVVDSAGVIVRANPAAAAILGCQSPDVLVGSNISALYASPADHDSLLSILGHRGAANRSIFDWRKYNGDPLLVELSSSPVHDPAGHVVGMHVTFHDITSKLKNQIEQQEVLAQTAGTFSESKLVEIINFYATVPMSLMLQGVAHNLNTPLGGIRGRAELILHNLNKKSSVVDGIADEAVRSELKQLIAKVQSGLTDIVQQVDKAGGLIRGFTDKISQELTGTAADIDLNRVIQAELDFMDSSLYFKHKVTRRVALDASLPAVHGHYKDFSLAVHSLIINSIRATAHLKERSLELATRYQGDAILLTLSDNRPPMTAEQIDYSLTVHWNSMYDTPPLEARFGVCDIEIPTARLLLEPYEAELRIDSGERTTLTLMIPAAERK